MAKADITGRLNLDSTGFERGIQRSKNAVGRMQKSVVNASNALAKMGLASASAAVLLLSRNAIQLGSYLSDVAESTGFATREFQVFRGALIDAGGKAENMEKAITLMQKAIVQGSEGMTTYTRAFERLGLNVDDLRKMKPEDQFQAIGKAIAGAKDQQGALTAAIEIFGQRNAPRLIEVFKRLDKDGYGKMAKDIEAAYGIMDEATQKALDRAADQIERFKNKATIKVGELIAGEADGAALKILGLSISKAGAQLGVGMVNGIMDSIAFARNSFGATADWLYSKISSSFEMIGIQFKLAMIEAANVAIEAANKISKLTLFETIDTGKVYDDLRQVLKDSNKEWASFFDERMSKQEEFDMKNRFGYDPGEFYDEAIEKQRELLEESRQVADNISEAFGTTGAGGDAGGTGSGGGTGSTGSAPKSKYNTADVNQSGYVTPREQRARETQQRKEDQARRAREREEISAEIGAPERERQRQRAERMTEREQAAGLKGTTSWREVGSGAMPTMEQRKLEAGLNLAGGDVMSGRTPSGVSAESKKGERGKETKTEKELAQINKTLSKLDSVLSGDN
jgi:hypothetical protein